MQMDCIFATSNTSLSNTTQTLKTNAKFSNYKVLYFCIGESGMMYDNLMKSRGGAYDAATGNVIMSVDDFKNGKALSSSYQSYSATLAYLSDTTINVTCSLLNNRLLHLYGIK